MYPARARGDEKFGLGRWLGEPRVRPRLSTAGPACRHARAFDCAQVSRDSLDGSGVGWGGLGGARGIEKLFPDSRAGSLPMQTPSGPRKGLLVPATPQAGRPCSTSRGTHVRRSWRQLGRGRAEHGPVDLSQRQSSRWPSGKRSFSGIGAGTHRFPADIGRRGS